MSYVCVHVGVDRRWMRNARAASEGYIKLEIIYNEVEEEALYLELFKVKLIKVIVLSIGSFES